MTLFLGRGVCDRFVCEGGTCMACQDLPTSICTTTTSDMPFSLTHPHKHSLTHFLSVHSCPPPSHTPALTTSTSHTPSITRTPTSLPHTFTTIPLHTLTLTASHTLANTPTLTTSHTHSHSLPLLTGPASQRARAVSWLLFPSLPQSCDPEETPPPPCWDPLSLG